jgi:hypothetical protein
MNRFEGRANARSSTTLPSTALNRFAMTEMTPMSGRCSGKRDSCDSLEPPLSGGWPPTPTARTRHGAQGRLGRSHVLPAATRIRTEHPTLPGPTDRVSSYQAGGATDPGTPASTVTRENAAL